MSWFDTSGLASLAKNALKEAQKQIDKALDIQEEEMSAATLLTEQKKQHKCKTEPTTPLQPLWNTYNPALWGSFTGSFFENPKAGEMVTTPPKGGLTPNEVSGKRQSVHSNNSDSVEILSPPTTPCSGMTSPSVTVYNSESVEVITTPTSSEILSPDSAISPDSVEVITSDEILDEDDDSMSFSTVMDDSIIPPPILLPTKSLPANQSIEIDSKQTDSCESIQTLIETTQSLPKQISTTSSSDDTLMECQTFLSDSTQSFEDVQIPDAISEEKDMVKVNSGPNSGHTSADEVETATSSDIEIISNPNGDSSSTNSACRASPIKVQCSLTKKNILKDLKGTTKKGHCREPSEVSTQSDDSQHSHSEADKLLRRISELSELLEAREFRLLEIGRQNAELQEKNIQIQAQLEAKQKTSEHFETEEYTQRLSALEKKFQMSIRERDALRDQLKTARNELSMKIPKNDLDKIVADKEFMIDELRTEGEKLSKQVLQHSNIIKKLRVKERENDGVLKKNREQIEELSEEVERLKKSLTAKEEVERSQIEAVHKLSSEKRKLEKETQSQRSQIEDLNSKLETIQTSLDAAKKELQDRQETHSELTRKTQALANLESEKQITFTQNMEMSVQMDDLREKLKIAEIGNTMREQKLRQDNVDLLRRLEAAELRSEELTQEVSLATIPLVRQLEALQSTLTARTHSWERQERELVSKLEEAQKKLGTLENVESNSKDQQNNLISRIKSLEERLSSALLKSEQTSSLLQQNEVDFGLKETDYQKQIETLQGKLENAMKNLDEIQEKYLLLERNLEIERVLHGKQLEEIKSNQENCSQVESNTLEPPVGDDINQIVGAGNSSPTLSLGRNSLADSLGSSAWQMDDLDCISNSGRQIGGGPGSVYGFGGGGNLNQFSHSTPMLESLQSLLKQRDGEINQLQWELSRLQNERNVLNTEISNLTNELENIKEKLISHETLEKDFTELQCQYDALLQMYGEKVEETQELELDLQDVKEMYKAQIDELLRQQNKS